MEPIDPQHRFFERGIGFSVSNLGYCQPPKITMSANLADFFFGLSGIELPLPKYQFPPEYQKTTRLTYYSTFFNSIEVNSSFYKIPMPATVARWASSVPEHFRFTFKLFKEISHVKNLDFDSSLICKFLDIISHVGNKKGCLLVQFPPGLKSENIHQLDRLLHSIQNANIENSWKVAVEFREKGWYTEDVYDLLSEYQSSLVIHDIQRSATPATRSMSDVVYVRFHGPTGNYRGSYTEAFLHEYAEYINEWLTQHRTVYVYFNNTAGDAFHNLRSLHKLLT